MILLILTSFFIWLWIFRGFLTGELAIIHDALSYYDHIQFFVDHLASGIYPLWDSFWEYGSPNEFFLRRIGESNPLLLLVVLLVKLGLSFKVSYFSFLSLYYLLACFGFYLVSKKLFGDVRMAFTAFALLMFSTLMTILFDSFIILIFTPIVWFFYFLIEFGQKPSKGAALGITFSLMLIVSTYIPFYFLTIFLTFLFSICILYFKETKEFLLKAWGFIVAHKIFVFLCLAALAIALIPGVQYFLEAKAGEIAIPRRNFQAPVSSAVAVGPQPIAAGGIVTSIMFKRLLVNLTQAQLGMFYFPIFAVCCLLLSLMTTMSKRTAFFLLWGGIVYVISLYAATPVYPFLYEHVFFFKYFRNFQFFLWLLILQVIILISVEQFWTFIKELDKNKKGVRLLKTILMVLLHSALIGLLYFLKTASVTSYVVVFLSAGYFSLIIWNEKFRYSTVLFPSVLLILIVVQPVQTFHYLTKNSPPKDFKYQYEGREYLKISYLRNPSFKDRNITEQELRDHQNTKSGVIYYGLQAYNDLHVNVYGPLVNRYVNHLFYLYDDLEFVKEGELDYQKLEQVFLKGENKVFVEKKEGVEEFSLAQAQNKAQPVVENSSQIRIVNADTNTYVLDLNLADDKFLVVTDNYHSKWRAYIDKQEVPLFKSNGSFKGLFVPKGAHRVVLRFKAPMDYFIKIFYMLVFQIVFISLVVSYFRKKPKNEKSSK